MGGTTRAPTPFGDTQSNTPRTQSTTTTPRSKGYVPVKTATKLDIGDLDEMDENALFRADFLNKGDGSRSISQEIDLMKGWHRFYRSDEDWQPWEQHAPIPIKPWFRAVTSLVQVCSRMLAHVCSRMLTDAHGCSRMLTYADVC